jgi:uncharacterized protein (DUF488 family)
MHEVSAVSAKPTVYTVGHGNRSIDELIATLQSGGVGLLVDVRAHPGSRHVPHFARDALMASLPAAHIAYAWRGEGLGGRRRAKAPSRHIAWRNPSFQAYADYMDTPTFRAALARLQADARGYAASAAEDGRGGGVAIMCAETVWWRCHRRLIADALTVDGFAVVHLLGPTTRQNHALHPDLRVDERGFPVYDLHAPLSLL